MAILTAWFANARNSDNILKWASKRHFLGADFSQGEYEKATHTPTETAWIALSEPLSDGYLIKLDTGKYCISPKGKRFVKKGGYRWQETKSILKFLSPILISLTAIIISLISLAIVAIVNRKEIMIYIHSKLWN